LSEGTKVASVILAAGTGTRFGGSEPKPLLQLRGRSLLSYATDAVLATDLRPVVLVVGHRGRAVGDAAPAGVNVVRARGYRKGIAHSLRAALQALDGWPQVGAVVVGLADQPRVGPEAYRRMAAAYDEGATLAVATYGGRRANPVMIARTLWGEARRLEGDEGARVLMRTLPVVEVPCDGTGDPVDVDTPEALSALEHAMEMET
jgi:molybdenum cofactor cytidylyltransferase/nicotine blue oxidoreductase